MEFTLVDAPDPGSALMCEEIFGPILPVVTVGSLDEAIGFVIEHPKSPAAYLFGSSRREGAQVITKISAGGIVASHAAMHCLVPGLRLGGVGNSGMGGYHGSPDAPPPTPWMVTRKAPAAPVSRQGARRMSFA